MFHDIKPWRKLRFNQLVTTIFAFQKRKNLPTAYLSRRYMGNKFCFSIFLKKADEVVKRNLKRYFLKNISSRQKTQSEKVFSLVHQSLK
jgi:hypothetical protein